MIAGCSLVVGLLQFGVRLNEPCGLRRSHSQCLTVGHSQMALSLRFTKPLRSASIRRVSFPHLLSFDIKFSFPSNPYLQLRFSISLCTSLSCIRYLRVFEKQSQITQLAQVVDTEYSFGSGCEMLALLTGSDGGMSLDQRCQVLPQQEQARGPALCL